MGLVVNQSLEDMRFVDILEELKIGDKEDIIRLPEDIREREVLRGGPAAQPRLRAASPDYFREELLFGDRGYLPHRDAGRRWQSPRIRPATPCSHWAIAAEPRQLRARSGNGWLTVPFARPVVPDADRSTLGCRWRGWGSRGRA
jgi:putative transcriptional regulator